VESPGEELNRARPESVLPDVEACAGRAREGVAMRATSILSTVLAVGAVVLAGCGSSYNGNSGAGGGGSSGSGSSASAANAELATADSSLGEIVVDGKGMTVYVFDKDTKGSGQSACSGDCLVKWPAVVAESDSPAVDGVTGEVGTITRDDGTKQVTLGGMPLYLFAGDAKAGDVTGQGVGGVWWVVSADGAKVTAAPASEPAPQPSY
jgi:predicted lipoprotein with Yx(FWY)xxD motif